MFGADTLSENLETTSQSAITMVKNGIHNPGNPQHFMRLKSCSRKVRIWRGETLLAETNNAIRLMEVGSDIYDPVFYVPKDAVLVKLEPVPEKSTHCPLKGDASYYQLSGDDLPDGDYFAWSYDTPFDFADGLKGLVAFNANKVRVEEIGE